jgi:DNA mismatch endonuclease (patch repair protein)
MADRVSSQTRSYIMSTVRTRDTGPELLLRRLLHSKGYRYALNVQRLPGRPDLVFVWRRRIVFVHGCFWHGHHCRWGKLPKTKLSYWAPKIENNRARDQRNLRKLVKLGWKSKVVWQCQLRNAEKTVNRVISFLEKP